MKNSQITRGVVLEVPYVEKDEAKHLGARWDAEIKKWFVPSGHDPKPFEKWIRSNHSTDSLKDY